MDGSDERLRPRLSFKQRLGFKGLGCCGPTWSFRSNTISVDLDSPQLPEEFTVTESPTTMTTTNTSQSQTTDPDCLLSAIPVSSPTTSGMNLAAALAAERQFRESTIANEGGGGRVTAPATPLRVSLLRLLEETEDEITENEKVTVGNDTVCCVCMGRKKGAAFIPCGHTFCRVCSRELWLNRGFCPLCNRSILEILDIF